MPVKVKGLEILPIRLFSFERRGALTEQPPYRVSRLRWRAEHESGLQLRSPPREESRRGYADQRTDTAIPFRETNF